ncbi:MAG TPA: FAD-binding oxidoreductase [Gemmatimonadales bacterium]|jgi:FAD/FMN-containing dehydrogenase|nr:FAD-binding oxidoreductase [Gemmatimonadales bacterium]
MLPAPAIRGIYRTDQRARAAYSEGAGIYRILPRAVCLPADVEDLKVAIGWAADQRVPLVPRGAGSAMGGGNVGDGVVVDLTGMAGRRLEIDAKNRRAVTSAGVTLAELNTAANRHGLRLPPDPSSGRWATLGGMVSTNAAGARSVRYGSVRRWTEGVTLLTADGETVELRRKPAPTAATTAAVARFEREAAPQIRAAAPLVAARFPRTRKNSSGYALDAYLASGEMLDLIIGAEGTLGIVSEIEWRLDHIPPFRAGLRVHLASLDRLSDLVIALNRCEPSALELLDRTFLDLIGAGTWGGVSEGFVPEAILLVELERSDPEALREVLAAASEAIEPWAISIETAYSPPEAERLWAIRHAASPILAGLPEDRRSLQVIEDACVPIERMGEYIRIVRRAAAERDLPVVMFGHAGDGHIHVNLLPDVRQTGWKEAITGILEAVTDAVVRLGGTPSGEHGDGRLRADTLAQVYGSEIVELFRLVKLSFDPLGILNPGVILPSGDPPISRLKVGSKAVALPSDIEQGLREIERGGGYGRARLELAGELGARS